MSSSTVPDYSQQRILVKFFYFNTKFRINPGGNPWYRGISYNPSNGFIYVAPYNLGEIQVFNSDLNLYGRISTSPHQPYSITFSSNELYVGTTGGIILVYQMRYS